MKRLRIAYALGVLFFIAILIVLFFQVLFHGPRGPAYHSLVSREKAELKMIGDALESYFSDHRFYPTATRDHDRRLPMEAETDLSSFQLEGAFPLTAVGLTAYLAALPHDPLAPALSGNEEKHRRMAYAYFPVAKHGWVLIGRGPNERFDIDYETLERICVPDATLPPTALLHYCYDPTNGAPSGGDVFRCGP